MDLWKKKKICGRIPLFCFTNYIENKAGEQENENRTRLYNFSISG